ncbi:hypothetical protein AB0M43_00310 [Longispora sp. NPDC051575]|uniref:hypothetical protein n=1 Tax=Longispora sp. NPDC051575 TaxID=3154943 RepID=UPI00344693EC
MGIYAASIVEQLRASVPGLESEVRPVSFDPTLTDLWMWADFGPDVCVSFSGVQGPVRVMADEYVFDHVPEAVLGEFLARLYSGPLAVASQHFLGRRSLRVEISLHGQTWSAMRDLTGEPHDWERAGDTR